MFADRIKTPLLLISSEQDHNVPARQAMEMYYAPRPLGKEVEWVSDVNGGHGMPTTTEEEVRDYHKHILDWHDSHLKGDQKKNSAETAEGNRNLPPEGEATKCDFMQNLLGDFFKRHAQGHSHG